MRQHDAVVVGAGPNGLAAAVVLAEAGADVLVLEARDTIGGGARSRDDLTVPGLLHDICSAFHPFAAASPLFRRLPLEQHGLRFVHPEVPLAHPLDGRDATGDGRAGVLHRDLGATADGLGLDGATWRRWFGGASEHFDDLADDLLGPLLRVPRHPLVTGRLGLRGLLPAAGLIRSLKTDAARSLFAGIAAHAFLPLEHPLTASFGLMLGAAGHAVGWPVAAGGSQAIAGALAAHLRSLGGEIVTGTRVRRLGDLPRTRVALLDVTPTQLLRIAGDRLPSLARRRAARWRHGPAAFKVDLAVEGGIPWLSPAARRAGTVHVAGSADEVAAAERDAAGGRLPERPFVLVGQQYLADPPRSVGDVHPIWAYAHVPNGFTGDAMPPILAQLERFAPGTTDRIVGSRTWTPADLEEYNENYVGGDISGGSHGGLQLVGRPRLSLDPYATGVPGLYLCSAATPPGAGVHGMAGFHAARSALRALDLGQVALSPSR